MDNVKVFRTGVEGLDTLVGELYPPYTVLVAGHPGSGKTTLAASICYFNTVKGNKCLYVTVYEEKEKFYRFMEKLGLRFRDVEEKGLFKFIRFPLALDVDKALEVISKTVSEEGFDIVVVDSVTALIDVLKLDVEKRALLLNYFYQLPTITNGLLILIAELPHSREALDLGSAEFIADAVIILKNVIEEGFAIRLMEIRKVRGKPIHIAEVPFTMVENKGVKIYVPPILEEIPKQKEEIYLPCRYLNEKIGHVHKDFVVNIFSPPETVYGKEALLLLLSMAIKYNLKILVISYISSPATLRESLTRFLHDYGIEENLAVKILDNYVVLKGINPYAQSLTELASKELELIDQYNPDIVVFHGVHVIKHDYVKYFRELYNQILYLKYRGIGIVRIGNCVNEERCADEASISDLTFKIERIVKESGYDFIVKIFRRFRDPQIVSSREIRLCLEEAINDIKNRLEKIRI
jgi:circadian clock protein KaiC